MRLIGLHFCRAPTRGNHIIAKTGHYRMRSDRATRLAWYCWSSDATDLLGTMARSQADARDLVRR